MILYRRDLMQFVTFSRAAKVHRLDEATAEHLEMFEERLRKVGSPRIRQYPKKHKKEEKKIRAGPNKPKTIRSKMKTVRQMIKWAVRRRLIDHGRLRAHVGQLEEEE